MAIHLNSLYIFALKILKYSEKKVDKIEHESFFHENYSHRCFTKFYGILKHKKEKIGFVYEYMCNDSLKFLKENHPEKIDDLYKLMTINRLFQGIEYLYKNSLSNIRLKPLNILIDHDYIPYISVFSDITNASNISNFSDIISYGQIIYFLYKKNDKDSKNKAFLQATKRIQDLHQFCIQLDPDKSFKYQQIKSIIIDEINSFDNIERYFQF